MNDELGASLSACPARVISRCAVAGTDEQPADLLGTRVVVRKRGGVALLDREPVGNLDADLPGGEPGVVRGRAAALDHPGDLLRRRVGSHRDGEVVVHPDVESVALLHLDAAHTRQRGEREQQDGPRGPSGHARSLGPAH
ncbi:hypothetical protein GCM10025786_28980 [Nocardioides caeni]